MLVSQSGDNAGAYPVRRAIAVGMLAGLTLALPAGSANAQTFEETLKMAYESNPQLLAARARLRAADEGVALAVSGWRPSVTLNGDYGWQRSETDTDTTTGATTTSTSETRTTTPARANVTIDQNIYRGGRTVAATRRAENEAKSERARLHNTEQEVLLSAVTSYMNVVRDIAIVDLNRSNIKVLTRQLEATRDRFRVGEVTRTDVAQAESRLARGNADLIRAEGSVVRSRATFGATVGQPPLGLQPVKPPTDITNSEDDAVKRARRSNPNVEAARYTEAAARSRVREVTGELYPILSVQGVAGITESSSTTDSASVTTDTDTSSVSTSITARLTIPLYTGGAVSARVREAKQIAGQRREELSLAIRTAMEAGSQTWETLQTARARIRALSSEIRAAQIALEGVQQEALVGSRTVLDVLDAEQELFIARVNLVSALRDEVVAAYQLRTATGDLTAAKLKLAVKIYNPEKYHNDNRGRWFGTGID